MSFYFNSGSDFCQFVAGEQSRTGAHLLCYAATDFACILCRGKQTAAHGFYHQLNAMGLAGTDMPGMVCQSQHLLLNPTTDCAVCHALANPLRNGCQHLPDLLLGQLPLS